MKKLFLFTAAVLLTASALNAQFTRIGGGVAFTSGFHYNNEKTGFEADLHRSPLLGVFVTGIYEIKLPIHIAPSFTYFIPRTNEIPNGSFPMKTRVSSMMFDLNGHFVFNSLDRFELYGIGGLDVLLAKLKWLSGTGSDHDNAIGLNLGIGTYIKATKQMEAFAEAKYIVSKYGQFMINAGVLVNINYIIKHSKEPI